MPAIQKLTRTCKKCGRVHEMEFPSSVNAASSPELKEKTADGSLFTWTCPHCGELNLVDSPFLYHDPTGKLMILLTRASVKTDELPEGYTGRLVRSAGELIEKIRIFDSGLDDIVMELCKYVTLSEMGKTLALKFFKIDGADSEMTFTYPEDGNMQMLAVGFNVYEDCAGILRRNPSIRETVRGLATVDADWISRFFA